MADLARPGSEVIAQMSAGPFDPLARAQYAALAAMRTRLFVNNFRSNQGVFELGARAIAFVVYGCMGVGLGIGAGAVVYSFVSRKMWQVLPIEFWVVCFLWQAVSVALASFQEQFDLGTLLRFPISFGPFYALCVVFGLVDASTLLGGLCSIGILIGVTIARPDLFGWIMLSLVLFAVFNILLARAILAWIDRWLAKRRSREIVSAIFLLSVVSLQLLNPALRQPGFAGRQGHGGDGAAAAAVTNKVRPWVKHIGAVQAWLPPGLIASAVEQTAEHEPALAAISLSVLGLYALAAGGALGLRLRAEYRGENLGEAPNKSKVETREIGWLIAGTGPISAVIEKDLRTLMRSMPQLYAVCIPMLMVFIIGSVFRNGMYGSRHPFQFALPVCVAYGLLGFAQLIYNNLGPEGKGIQMLFLFPVPVRTVMLAKNLFHAMLFILVAVISGVLAGLRLGVPSGLLVMTTLAWLAFALPANLAAGNVLSVTMAYRVNLGRIGRQAGSQANALLSMLIQMTLLGVGAAVIGGCALFGRLWLATPILLALSAGAIFAWLKILGNVDRMANERRDVLMGKLARTE